MAATLGVITCVCALYLAAAIDIPLEGKTALLLFKVQKQTVKEVFKLDSRF